MRLVERLLHLLLEVLVIDVNHRTLAQCCQRLVRRMRDVAANARSLRVGNESRVQPMAVVLRIAELLLELRVSAVKVGVAEALPQPRRRAHAGTPPIRWMEAGEGEPGFVPEED